MIRTLIATMALTATMSAACPTCGCRDANTDTVSDEAKSADACATECAASCESGCEQAAVTAVAGAGDDCSSTCDAAATCSGAASVSFASYIPAMTYKVGDESMTCSKMAGSMAKEHNTHLHYVVNGVEYDSHTEAMTAHAKQLQGMMMDLVRVQYAVNGECVACPDTAKEMAASCESKTLQYRVGPAIFDNADDAIKASMMAYSAAMSTTMEYAVGDATTTCAVSASEMAKAADCSVEYVVNGQRTGCKTSAGYMKTLASVQNALKALETAAGTTATNTAPTAAPTAALTTALSDA